MWFSSSIPRGAMMSPWTAQPEGCLQQSDPKTQRGKGGIQTSPGALDRTLGSRLLG